MFGTPCAEQADQMPLRQEGLPGADFSGGDVWCSQVDLAVASSRQLMVSGSNLLPQPVP
jgi:hypothetical protein